MRWACLETGVPVRTREYEGEEPVEYICSVNIGRRHMTPLDRALFAASVRERYAEEAAARQRAGVPLETLVALATEVDDEEGRVRDTLALRFAVSAAMMAKVLAIANGAPELLAEIRSVGANSSHHPEPATAILGFTISGRAAGMVERFEQEVPHPARTPMPCPRCCQSLTALGGEARSLGHSRRMAQPRVRARVESLPHGDHRPTRIVVGWSRTCASGEGDEGGDAAHPLLETLMPCTARHGHMHEGFQSAQRETERVLVLIPPAQHGIDG
jgi:hypothetical protein